jgi:hypothetical protein
MIYIAYGSLNGSVGTNIFDVSGGSGGTGGNGGTGAGGTGGGSGGSGQVFLMSMINDVSSMILPGVALPAASAVAVRASL